MSYDRTYQRTSTTRNRRPLYAPPPPPGRSNQRQHSVLGYWVPLIVTGGLAIGGLAAWIWSERQHYEDDEHYPHDKPPRPGGGGPGGPYPYSGPPRPGGPSGPPPMGGPQRPPSGPPGPPPYPEQGLSPHQGGPPLPGGEAVSYFGSSSSQRAQSRSVQEENTWVGRVGGMMKQAPSPQQVFDSASKQVSAGVAAAGSALGSIWEGGEEVEERSSSSQQRVGGERRDVRRATAEERDGFSDHERWSEEAEERRNKIRTVDLEGAAAVRSSREAPSAPRGGKAKRSVAVVVSADTALDLEHDEQTGRHSGHASILSHLPPRHSTDPTDIFILIYAPNLESLPPTTYNPPTAPTSTTSTPAATPGSELTSISPRIHPTTTNGSQFDHLYAESLPLVADPNQILAFTTRDGYIHLLRHLAPSLVYVSDTLAGHHGETIAQLKGWVGQVVLVAGDEGFGGLVDTETETEDDEGKEGGRRERRRWYEGSELIGLGKVEVVDVVRVVEDWGRRVGGRE